MVKQKKQQKQSFTCTTRSSPLSSAAAASSLCKIIIIILMLNVNVHVNAFILTSPSISAAFRSSSTSTAESIISRKNMSRMSTTMSMAATRTQQRGRSAGNNNGNGTPKRNKKRKRRNNNRNGNNSNNNKQNSQKQTQTKIKTFTNEEIHEMTIGQAIQESKSIQQLLITASRMWIPTDDNLPQHIVLQSVHHEKRFRSSCLLLLKLSDYIHTSTQTSTSSICNTGTSTDDQLFNQGLWTNNQDFKRVILAATLPFESNSNNANVSSNSNNNSNIGSSGIDIDKEGRFVTLALVALFTLAGYTLPPLSRNTSTSTSTSVDEEIIESIQILIDRAESLASHHLAFNQAIEVRWAIRGLYNRIPTLANGDTSSRTHTKSTSTSKIPNLNRRVKNLPFDIIPNCIDWAVLQQKYHDPQNDNSNISSDNNNNSNSQSNSNSNDIIKTLLHEIPFKIDTITTRTGSSVQERRSTAWVAEHGIGSLAYSGKLMNPKPIPSIVQYSMREVEKSILQHDSDDHNSNDYDSDNDYDHNGFNERSVHDYTDNIDYRSQLKLCVEQTGSYFDCALTNHYPELDSACKFHTDPEHGTFWERLTCVISAGDDDIRKFAFRPIPQMNDWYQWDNNDNNRKGKGGAKSGGGGGGGNDAGIEPAVIHLFPGDCVKMWGACNDVFHHAVYGADQVQVLDGAGTLNQKQLENDGRVSLVFKRAMDRGNGRKGHGQRGEGRRSRRL
jgi:hypothetical protein